MNYQHELQFLLRFFHNHKIKTFFYEPGTDLTSIDFRLRELLNYKQGYKILEDFLVHQLHPNTIYSITDEFQCVYHIIILPLEAGTKPFIIGPYLQADISQAAFLEYMENYSITPQLFQQLMELFTNIPTLPNDLSIHTLVQTFGEIIWNGRENFQTRHLDHSRMESKHYLLPQSSFHEAHSHIEVQLLDTYLTRENDLLQAVSQGQTAKAEEILSMICTLLQIRENDDMLQNLHNYALSLNTLLRKMAETHAIDSIHIFTVFAHFAKKIEHCSSSDTYFALLREIVRKYCLLIKNHSMNQYSILVQQTIKYVHMDLTADLTLHAMAKRLNVNASYLSTHFKKVTGIAYTEYVNHKRIDHSLLLLNTTSLQIQTIAQYCGISDLNYFTKLFKKYIHMSPTAYRKTMQEK